MRYLRGYIPTTMLAITLMLGTMTANAGIMILDAQGNPTSPTECSEPVETKVDWGIMILDFVIGKYTGIEIKTSGDDVQVNCGIMILD